MKANEAPERLYLSKNIYSTFIYQVPDPDDESAVEYTRTDAFIEKAAKWLDETLRNADFYENEIELIIKEFKKEMKGE